MNTIVISAFPASGKTYATEHCGEWYKILDLDTSDFTHIRRKRTESELEEMKQEWERVPHKLSGDGYVEKHKDEIITVPNTDFPQNYIECIKENIGKYDVIFVSSYLKVRQAMQDAGIVYCTVYPNEDMLNEWIGRMYMRGDSMLYIERIIYNWSAYVRNIESEPHGKHVFRLINNEYIDQSKLDILITLMDGK